MAYIVDRRLNGKNRSSVNRQRFVERYRKQIRRAVSDAVSERSITDIDRGEQVTIPRKDISEPRFFHGSGGQRTIVHPGNKEFVTGDRIERPKGGGGDGGRDGSPDGEGSDDFMFSISKDEFMEFLFEDLELPNLVKRQLAGTDSFKTHRAGVVNEGNPAQINIVRSMRAALSRRIAMTAPTRARLDSAKARREALLLAPDPDGQSMAELEAEIEELEEKIRRTPYLDTFDLRYSHQVKQPIPSSKAVMFCLMDVSGSMNQSMKDMGKRFFLLLYLFLQRNYDRTEIIFIRHHTSAKEVDEQEFFYSRETGGTIVSSALRLMHQIILERFPPNEWNIYGAQASDGDNWADDSPNCRDILQQQLLPITQYFTYVEITPRRHQSLWDHYQLVQESASDQFAMQEIQDTADIYPVFRELFKRKVA